MPLTLPLLSLSDVWKNPLFSFLSSLIAAVCLHLLFSLCSSRLRQHKHLGLHGSSLFLLDPKLFLVSMHDNTLVPYFNQQKNKEHISLFHWVQSVIWYCPPISPPTPQRTRKKEAKEIKHHDQCVGISSRSDQKGSMMNVGLEAMVCWCNLTRIHYFSYILVKAATSETRSIHVMLSEKQTMKEGRKERKNCPSLPLERRDGERREEPFYGQANLFQDVVLIFDFRHVHLFDAIHPRQNSMEGLHLHRPCTMYRHTCFSDMFFLEVYPSRECNHSLSTTSDRIFLLC